MSALGSRDPLKLAAQMRAGLEYRQYCLGVIADRRSKPRGKDLLSVLVRAEIDGNRLDDESIFMESLLILIGGDETTRHVISGGMHQLLVHPEQCLALRANPSQLPRAIEEMLRWVTPIQNMMRTVRQPVEIAGHGFREGDRLPDLTLASDVPPPLRPENFVVGIESVPLRFTPVPLQG